MNRKGSRHLLTCAGSLALVLLLAPTTSTAGPLDRYLYRLNVVTSTQPVPVVRLPDQLQYTTPSGYLRTVPIAIRFPPGVSQGRLPVVIWAHGGGAQPPERDPATTLPSWGEFTARAGYVSINVLHVRNPLVEQPQHCQAIGYPIVSNPAAIIDEVHALIDAIATGNPQLDLADLAARFPELAGDLDDLLSSHIDEDVAEIVLNVFLKRISGCRSINDLGMWDRPHDIEAVVNALHAGTIPELDGWIDRDRIAVAGHSNGTSSVLNAVGMKRALPLPTGVKVDPPFPLGHPRRPIAAVALSPMGVNDWGLFDTGVSWPSVLDSQEHSWVGLESIPVMTITGDGDNHCAPHRYLCSASDSGGTRTVPFLRMPGGDKYLMFVGDRDAAAIVSSHELFGDLERADCPTGHEAQCASTRRWVKSTVLAFLDAHVRGSAKARRWLDSDRLERASQGVTELRQK